MELWQSDDVVHLYTCIWLMDIFTEHLLCSTQYS